MSPHGQPNYFKIACDIAEKYALRMRAEGSLAMSQHTVRGENMRPTEYANPCGCRYHLTRHPPIAFCSTHAAAPRMLAALKDLAEHAHHTPMCGCDHEQNDPACHVGRACAVLKDIDGEAEHHKEIEG